MSIRKTIELVTNSSGRYITPSGLSIIGNMLSRSEFVQYCNQRRDLPKRSEPQIPNGDIILTMIGLLVQGKPQFDSVNEMKSDPEYYRVALGLKRGVPSSETLRQRLDAIGESSPQSHTEGECKALHRPWCIAERYSERADTAGYRRDTFGQLEVPQGGRQSHLQGV